MTQILELFPLQSGRVQVKGLVKGELAQIVTDRGDAAATFPQDRFAPRDRAESAQARYNEERPQARKFKKGTAESVFDFCLGTRRRAKVAMSCAATLVVAGLACLYNAHDSAEAAKPKPPQYIRKVFLLKTSANKLAAEVVLPEEKNPVRYKDARIIVQLGVEPTEAGGNNYTLTNGNMLSEGSNSIPTNIGYINLFVERANGRKGALQFLIPGDATENGKGLTIRVSPRIQGIENKEAQGRMAELFFGYPKAVRAAGVAPGQ